MPLGFFGGFRGLSCNNLVAVQIPILVRGRFDFEGKNQIFKVFGIQGNAEQVPVNHVVKSVRSDLFGRTRGLSIVPHAVTTIVKIFPHAGLILFVGKRDAHDGSAFLAMDDPGKGQMIVRVRREARGLGHEALNVGKKIFGMMAG
jgi:hypothetical protein